MIKRIEFTLNLDDPLDVALYEALTGLLKRRQAGALIRQAPAAAPAGACATDGGSATCP